MVWVDIIPDWTAFSHLFAPDDSSATVGRRLALFCSSSDPLRHVETMASLCSRVFYKYILCLQQQHSKIILITFNWMTSQGYCQGNQGAFCCRTGAVRRTHCGYWNLPAAWLHDCMPRKTREHLTGSNGAIMLYILHFNSDIMLHCRCLRLLISCQQDTELKCSESGSIDPLSNWIKTWVQWNSNSLQMINWALLSTNDALMKCLRWAAAPSGLCCSTGEKWVQGFLPLITLKRGKVQR